MNSKINYKVEDFLRDDEFICYVLNVSSEVGMIREDLLKKYSALTNEAEKARSILTGEDMEYSLSKRESGELLSRIFSSVS